MIQLHAHGLQRIDHLHLYRRLLAVVRPHCDRRRSLGCARHHAVFVHRRALSARRAPHQVALRRRGAQRCVQLQRIALVQHDRPRVIQLNSRRLVRINHLHCHRSLLPIGGGDAHIRRALGFCAHQAASVHRCHRAAARLPRQSSLCILRCDGAVQLQNLSLVHRHRARRRQAQAPHLRLQLQLRRQSGARVAAQCCDDARITHAVVDDGLRSCRTVIGDPLRSAHRQSNASVGCPFSQHRHRFLIDAAVVLFGKRHGMKQNRTLDPRGILAPAAILRKIIPLHPLRAVLLFRQVERARGRGAGGLARGARPAMNHAVVCRAVNCRALVGDVHADPVRKPLGMGRCRHPCAQQ